MRNPRIDPRPGDALEHPSGEKRTVLAIVQGMVRYREGGDLRRDFVANQAVSLGSMLSRSDQLRRI